MQGPRGNFPAGPVVATSRGDAIAARIGQATVDGDELAEASDRVPPVSDLRESLVVLHLDPLAPRTPRLPHRRLGALTQLVASTALHMTLVAIAALIAATSGIDVRRAERITDQQRPDVRHIVFLAPELPRPGSGGGGGGNQRPDPIRHAQGVGADTITLRVRKEPPPTAPVTTAAAPAVEDLPVLPSIVLDAKPLASGLFDQTRTADWWHDVRHIDRFRVRGRRRHGKRDRYRLGTWSRIRPWIRRWNWRWRLPRWRGSIRTAPDQRSQAQVHERGALKENPRHGGAGSHRHSRRMRVANPYRPFAGRRGPR